MERKRAKEKRKSESKSVKEQKAEAKSVKDQKAEAKSVKEQKLEILYLAQDVFHYLSSKAFPENPIQPSGQKSQFHENIGKACSYKLRFARVSLDEIYSKDYPDDSLGSKDFVDWFQKIIVGNFFKIPTTPFNVVIESLAYMFDVVAYGKRNGHTNLYTVLPFIWTEFYMVAIYPDFFKEGGWHCLLKRARDIVERYENFFLRSEPGAMELIAGLRKNDPARTVQNATGGIDPAKQLHVPQELQRAGLPAKMDESSDLAKTIQGLMELKVEGALKRLGSAYEIPSAPEATSKEDLPGCRKKDPVGISDHHLEDLLGSCPSNFEETALENEEESSTPNSNGDRADTERVPALGLYSEILNREEPCNSESTSSLEHTGARRKRNSRQRK